jgi:hypothetical protein
MPFSVYQGAWNVMYWGFERKIIPMARSEGDHIYPAVLNDGPNVPRRNVLASRKFQTDAEEEQRRATGEEGRKMLDPVWEHPEIERTVSALLEKVAKEVGTKNITAGKHA